MIYKELTPFVCGEEEPKVIGEKEEPKTPLVSEVEEGGETSEEKEEKETPEGETTEKETTEKETTE